MTTVSRSQVATTRNAGSVVEVCTGMGTAGIPRNPREIRGNEYRYRGKTAGMKLKLAIYYHGKSAAFIWKIWVLVDCFFVWSKI